MLHGCRRGSPPTIVVMRLSKNRSVCYGFNGRGDFTLVGGLIGRPGRWSPGLYPVPTQPQAPPCKFLGSPGGCQEGPTPGGLPPLPATGSTPGRQLRPRCRVSVPLPAEGVPSARHRTGGRHCLYRLESVTAPSLHRLPGTIPRGFATSRRVVVELSSFRPLQCSPGLSTPATSSG